MGDPGWFESLADISPGSCTLGDAICRWGIPRTSHSSDGGLFCTFPEHGVRVCVLGDCADNPQAVVDEVALIPPYAAMLPCGFRLGHPKSDALRVIRRSYLVTEEYEDAVYFRPSCNPQFLAAVEFMEADSVVLAELMYYSS